ncbi:hypothetical protein SASPL_102932 [Salvia splendens]|uniref:Uncharacterized protein n=1 Tax=Salvia splendens TaxID=180675 RepID=A0A8X9AED9_SALSN|nr:hypothetical protein SASPL_102932 [Salvia splendens]
MAYEALESLQQTLLLLILQRHDDHVIIPAVKQQIVSIHHKAVVLQFNLKQFPEKETIRELGQLAVELKSTVGDVVDYCKSNSDILLLLVRLYSRVKLKISFKWQRISR